jgi:hypothetical protein
VRNHWETALGEVLLMATFQERKRRGQEIVKKYKSCSGSDPYACAVDAIADILLFVAQTEDEGTQILQSAEMDFRNAVEGESFVTEG